MLDERRARLASKPLHDVQHARRHARLQGQLGEEVRGGGDVLGWLHHRCVAAEDRGEDLPREVRERRVEAHDQARNPERLPHGENGAMTHARGRRAAVGAPPLAGDEETHLDGGVRLAERELERLPGLGDDDLGCVLAASAKIQGELADDLSALDRGALGPLGLSRARGGRPPRRRPPLLTARGGTESRRRRGAACRATRPEAAGTRFTVDQVRNLVGDHRRREYPRAHVDDMSRNRRTSTRPPRTWPGSDPDFRRR